MVRVGLYPELVGKGNNHWAVNLKEAVTVGGKKAEQGLGISLNVVGHSEQ